MSEQRRGLGRGLGALIPSAPVGAGDTPSALTSLGSSPLVSRGSTGPGAWLQELPVDTVRPNPRQPRAEFDDDALTALAASVREVGVLQPIVVRESESGGYELVMGERRWRACRAAGLPTVPAIVRRTADDAMLRDALLENLHRADLNPLEEAAAYGQLLEEFGATHDELAARIGRSRPHITNTLRLLNLPPTVQRRVAAGVLSAGHARALLALDDPATQEALAGRIVAEGLSVRAAEEAAAVDRDGRPARSVRSTRPTSPHFDELAGRLSERLDTRVRVQMGRAKGKIVVEFASVEDLERILTSIAPGVGAPGTAEPGTAEAGPAGRTPPEVS